MPEALEFYAISLNFRINSYLWKSPIGWDSKKNCYFLNGRGHVCPCFWWYFVIFFVYILFTNGICVYILYRHVSGTRTTPLTGEQGTNVVGVLMTGTLLVMIAIGIYKYCDLIIPILNNIRDLYGDIIIFPKPCKHMNLLLGKVTIGVSQRNKYAVRLLPS